jgi:ribulose-phosphate 3-epimerase
VKLAPSILSADFGRLADEIRSAEQAGADYIHVDVMDGRFVPNITIGPLVVQAAKRATSLPLDVHLMIEEPERYIGEFVAAGASIVTVHQEACRHLQATLHDIRNRGARAGVSLCPATPISTLEELEDDVDLVLIMTVNPGFGGQRLIPRTVSKVGKMRRLLDSWGSQVELEVDGGVNKDTIADLAAQGADVYVAGSAVFDQGRIAANIEALRAAAAAGHGALA